MTISAGMRLGPYEVVSPLGAGGMGEVWKGRDTRLDRSVAIKVLPAEFAQNAQLRLRFEREARTISQLNHPNICTVYDVGEGYLVMELLDGETLADRILRGRMPLADTLRIGAQIGDALDRAHRAGIVHRDLKPGNVMLTKSGAKLLDFGLAKMNAPAAVSFDSTTRHATEEKPLTAEGAIVGTLQYMAPEQLEGLDADARTDIFALGEILYEMATGRRAFQGKSNTSLIAAIMAAEPQPIASIEPLTPPAFEHVVRKCLAKDPEMRWQSAYDVAEQLRWIGEGATVSKPRASAVRARTTWLLVILAAVLTGVVGWWASAQWRSSHERAPVYRLTISTPPGSVLGYQAGPMALSPDGRTITYASYSHEGNALLVRKLSEMAWQTIEGTTGARAPFWSDDGRQIAYFARGALWRVAADGSGPPQEIAKPPGLGNPTASWHGATIVLSVDGKLYRLNSSGGEAVPLNVFRDARAFFPHFLPDGSHFICSVARDLSDARVYYVVSVDGKEPPRKIGSGQHNAAYSDGRLFFIRDSSLFVQRFDLRTLTTTGAPAPLAKVQAYGRQAAYFSVAGSTLVYLPAGSEVRTQLARVDRTGKTVATIGQPTFIFSPRLSHRGTRVAVDRSLTSGLGDIWLLDTSSGAETRFTFAEENETAPIWTPSDTEIIYALSVTTGQVLMRKPAAGGEPSTVLALPGNVLFPGDFSADGRHLIAFAGGPNVTGASRVYDVSLPSGQVKPIATAGSALRMSPDSHWFAYAAYDPAVGGQEVFVEPLPPNGSKWQVSSEGGSMPVWRPDGKALFFVNETGKLVESTVSVSAGGFSWEPPQPLFGVALREGVSIAAQYDVFPDGTFLLNRIPETATTPMTAVINWQQALAD